MGVIHVYHSCGVLHFGVDVFGYFV